MKKLLLLSIILISSVAYADFGSSYKTAKDTVTGVFSKDSNNCPVHAETPFKNIKRADLDISVVFNILDNPGDGRYDVYALENYHIQMSMNLSNSFYVYSWAGQRKSQKTDTEDAIYEPEWNSRMLFGGVGIYLTPVFKIYGGGGKIWLKNDNDEEPPLDNAIEYGVEYDIAWGENKVVLSWKVVEAPLKDEDKPTSAELQGSGSYSSAGIGLSIPFMR